MLSQKNGHIKCSLHNNLSDEEALYIADNINSIYLEEEALVWPNDGRYERTNAQEVLNYDQLGELLVAKNENNEILGSLRLYIHDGRTYYGILITIREYRSAGIGGLLVQKAEEIAKSRGESFIYIELLLAKDGSLTNKQGMRQWYSSKGYVYHEDIRFDQKDPIKSKLMKIPCYFEIMRKAL